MYIGSARAHAYISMTDKFAENRLSFLCKYRAIPVIVEKYYPHIMCATK